MAIYGLLVGVNNYESQMVSDLGGCANDVASLKSVLQNRYSVVDSNLRVLLDKDATKQNIIDGFNQHLSKAGKDDTAVFYFSGHGSQEEADRVMHVTEDDRFNETLVCHDSRASTHYDLADKELRYLIYQVSQRGANIVTIIDCCHSGKATRNVEEPEGVKVRQVRGLNTARPLDSYIFYNDPSAHRWLNDFSKMPEAEYIAISASEDEELSKEQRIYNRQQGVFTYYLCQALTYALHSPSYHNLMQVVGQKVRLTVAQQTPRIDAIGKVNVHQRFLSQGIEPVEYPVFEDSGSWWLKAGVPQGVNSGAQIQISDNGSDLFTTTIGQILHDKSEIIVGGMGSWKLKQGHVYSAVITEPATPKLPIMLHGEANSVNLLRQSLQDPVFSGVLEEANEAPEYTVRANGNSTQLFRHDDYPLESPAVTQSITLPDSSPVALAMAAHMADWHRKLRITYATGDIPYDLIKLVIEQYDHSTGQYHRQDKILDTFNIHAQEVNGSTQMPRFKLSLELNQNLTFGEDIYASLLFFDPVTGEVSLIANKEIFRYRGRVDRDGNANVDRNERHHFHFTRPNGDSDINASVPQALLDRGITMTSDYLKLFISNFELDVSGLSQSSLVDLYQGLTQGGAKRSLNFRSYEQIHNARTETFVLNIHST